MTEAAIMAHMPPSLLADLERELSRVDRMLDRCVERLTSMAVMAGFPDAGDEAAGEATTLPARRLPAPPLPRRNLPPED